MQGFKSKQGKKAVKKIAHQSRKAKPQKQKYGMNERQDGKSTKQINIGVESELVGRVMNCQEKLRLINKQMLRDGTVNFGKGKSGRDLMRENRTKKIKIVLDRN